MTTLPSAADREHAVVSLNLYSCDGARFDEQPREVALLLATHASVALIAAAEKHRSLHLERALQTRTDIGVAIGVVMGVYKLTRADAFTVLRVSSQRLNWKLSELAVEVAESGGLPNAARSDRGTRSIRHPPRH